MEDDGSATWIPAIHVGGTNSILSSRIQPNPALAMVDISYQWMEDGSLAIPLFLCLLGKVKRIVLIGSKNLLILRGI